MDKINNVYYTGYEGEHEIQFIKIIGNETREILSIWDGYFDDIIELIKPEKSGWTGLAYHYHLYSGWYEESPWKIPNVKDVINQFNNIDLSNKRFDKSERVLLEIIDFLCKAIQEKNDVWIAFE